MLGRKFYCVLVRLNVWFHYLTRQRKNLQNPSNNLEHTTTPFLAAISLKSGCKRHSNGLREEKEDMAASGESRVKEEPKDEAGNSRPVGCLRILNQVDFEQADYPVYEGKFPLFYYSIL